MSEPSKPDISKDRVCFVVGGVVFLCKDTTSPTGRGTPS
jgi:hypothetical protein